MTNEQTIQEMKQWCIDHYDQGADTMVECWTDTDFEELFSFEGETRTASQAWDTLKSIAAVYRERQADARNSAF